METESNLNLDAIPAETGAVQIGYFSNQTKSGEIYQSFVTSSPFQQLFIWTPTLFRRILHTYICFDIYPGILGLQLSKCSLANKFCQWPCL